MIGRLIEQQQIRLPRESPGQQSPAFQATRERGKFLMGRQPDRRDQILDPYVAFPIFLVVIIIGTQSAINNIVHSATEVGRNFLGESRVD